ncbi:MAG: hypothetical protein ACD_29C00107G0006 [uncultured bacterium]|nr:MAG: hypothetical protein ACD_29C00107G0006 [uncultured bacterium]
MPNEFAATAYLILADDIKLIFLSRRGKLFLLKSIPHCKLAGDYEKLLPWDIKSGSDMVV